MSGRGRGGENAQGRGEAAGRGGANTPPRTSAGIMTLATGQVSVVERVSGVTMPEESSTWAAMHRGRAGAGRGGFGGRGGRGAGRGAAPEPAAAPAANQTPAEGQQADNAPRAKRKDNGSDLIVRNLDTGQDITIPLVSDFAWSKDGSWLAYAVSSAKAEEDGAFARKMSDGTIVALHKGKGNYKRLAFDDAGAQLAFLSDQAEYDKEVSPYRVYYWKAGDAAATELVSGATRGVPQGLVPSDQAAPRFSDDGTRLFVGTAPPPAPPAPEGARGASRRRHLALAGSDAAADAARARAAGTQSHVSRRRAPRRQALRAARDPGFSERRPGRRFCRAGHRHERPAVPQRDVVGHDLQRRGPRRSEVGSASTGASALARHATMSPGGRYLLYFDEGEADWFTYRISDGVKTNLTSKLNLNFWREDHDSPSLPPAYGAAGWTTKDASVLLCTTEYDIWEIKPDGSGPRMLTGGDGRKNQIVYRYRSLDPEERAIPVDKPILLSANDDKTESSGFYRVVRRPTPCPRRS